MSYAIIQGDVGDVLGQFPENFFHAILTDPPYGYSFMGKKWDYDVPSIAVWETILRTLRPGAPVLSFGGSRTFHRIACNIEDAGLEIRDCLTWLYAKGFPKSQNVSIALDKAQGLKPLVTGSRILTGNAAISCKEKGGTYGVQVGSIPPKEVPVYGPASDIAATWQGYGTALKPGWEPIILARKPLNGTMADNIITHGCGPLAIKDCRIGGQDWTQEEWSAKGASRPTKNTYGEHKGSDTEVPQGRWPANLLLDEEAGQLLDATVGNRPSRPSVTRNGGGNQGGALFTERTGSAKPDTGFTENGGPSRFFFSAKVSTKEREAGCQDLPMKSAGEVTDREDDTDGLNSPRAGAGRTGGARNFHPTLKPLALAEWLAKLIKPARDGVLLVPYSGSGSEIIGALKAGWGTVIGIEQDPDYIRIARARLAHWCPDHREES